MWYNKKNPDVLYLDERPECEPDVVGDYRNLKDFADNTFNLVVFDPPHVVRSTKFYTMRMVRDFGQLNPDTWEMDLKKAFKELFRVLKPFGFLIFKWSNHHIPSNKIIKLAGIEPLFYQISANKDRVNKQDKRKKIPFKGTDFVQTLWFCFMKKPERQTVGRQP